MYEIVWEADALAIMAMNRVARTGGAVSMREVRDAAGTLWTIFDVRPSTNGRARAQVKPGYGDGWLCFQCDSERRRHPGVPLEWTTLPDDALLTLIESAADTRLAPLRSR